MAPQKSNNDKKKEAEAAGRAPKCVLHVKHPPCARKCYA